MTLAAGHWDAIGVFGGTFDPVHFGHLRTAFEVQARLGMQEVRFIPCADPPHREAPVAPAGLRLRMLEAATSGVEGFSVDDRELERGGPSYTVDTLRSLRAEFPDKALCLLLGLDAFAGLAGWLDWQALPELAHIVVARRPGASAPSDGDVGRLLQARRVREPERMRAAPRGLIHVIDVTQLEISSSRLRSSMAEGLSPVYLLPAAVLKILIESNCYGTEAL